MKTFLSGRIFLILIIIVSIFVVYFFMNRSSRPSEISEEVVDSLKRTAPTVSKEEDDFLRILEQNAVSGGPGKDGIPAIEKPQYTTASEGNKWLQPNDIVFGVDYSDFVAAYPQRILVWHEIVNETLRHDSGQAEKVAITYCPLTGTAIGFKGAIVESISSTFGVSGKLVNSNLIMYDRASDSYWPQILGKAINGAAYGRALEEFPIVWTTWERWKKKYPNTKVLSRETGFVRNYNENGDPYGSYIRDDKGYYGSDSVLFRPIYEDKRLSPKTVVVGIRDEKGNAVAILKESLRRQKTIETKLGEKTIVVVYDPDLDFHKVHIKGNPEEIINSFDAMWFAWVAFYPDKKLVQ